MGIKEMYQKWLEDKKEKAAFQDKVNKEILPIRRAAYLEERKKQAIKEGQMIAQKVFDKVKGPQKQTKDTDDPFNLENPLKFINKHKEDKNGS